MVEPTRPKARLKASGGMSPEGTTTDVTLSGLDPADKRVLCSAICHCNNVAPASSGRRLKQSCVSKRLRALDELLHHRSPYKPEQPYDMTRQPPAPVMARDIETKPHRSLPSWVRWIWPRDPEHPPYRRGTGMAVQPDVVVVRNPNALPTQDNIKQIVEIKFPGDTWGSLQRQRYEEIAGDPSKVVELDPDECDCASLERQTQETLENSEQASKVAALLMALLSLLTKGRAGRPPSPMPAPAI
ncbi:VRR-NUC domain-containing protein [Luteimonas salinisoli]|nr:VRR-NUC domain-containing protein [Luteimonas salinisoli]